MHKFNEFSSDIQNNNSNKYIYIYICLIRYEKFKFSVMERVIYEMLYIRYMQLPLEMQREYMRNNPNTKMVDAENDNHDRKELNIKENMDNNRQNGELVSTENNEERNVC